jgi:hypothetical protein
MLIGAAQQHQFISYSRQRGVLGLLQRIFSLQVPVFSNYGTFEGIFHQFSKAGAFSSAVCPKNKSNPSDFFVSKELPL